MIQTASWQAAQVRRAPKIIPTFRGHTVPLIETPPAAAAGQAFAVEQQPDWLLPAHFHNQDQFQLVVAGSGTIGRDPLQPLAVHFASAHSAYGPIRSFAYGLTYYTLRAVTDTGAHYMPEARGRMRRDLPKRHVLGEPVQVAAPEVRRGRTHLAWTPVIAAQADGLASCLVHLPPGAVLQSSALPGLGTIAGARFYYVAAGTLLFDGQAWGEHDLLHAQRGASSFPLAAGRDGLDLLVLQFPESSSELLPPVVRD